MKTELGLTYQMPNDLFYCPLYLVLSVMNVMSWLIKPFDQKLLLNRGLRYHAVRELLKLIMNHSSSEFRNTKKSFHRKALTYVFPWKVTLYCQVF